MFCVKTGGDELREECICKSKIERLRNGIVFVAFTLDRRGISCSPNSRWFLHHFTNPTAATPVVITISPPVIAHLEVKKWL